MCMDLILNYFQKCFFYPIDWGSARTSLNLALLPLTRMRKKRTIFTSYFYLVFQSCIILRCTFTGCESHILMRSQGRSSNRGIQEQNTVLHYFLYISVVHYADSKRDVQIFERSSIRLIVFPFEQPFVYIILDVQNSSKVKIEWEKSL